MEENKENLQNKETGEAGEVVSWYVPRQGREVVDCYIHSRPLPKTVSYVGCEEPAAPGKSRKRRRIFLGGIALLLAVAVGGTFLFGSAPSEVTEDGEQASSIVDIFQEEDCGIPACETDPTVQMALAEPAEEVLTAQEIFAKVCPSTVTVLCTMGAESTSMGTGVILTEDGYFITNAHVVSGGTECAIATDEGVTYDAQLVGLDAAEDIAVLKAVGAHGLTPAEFCSSEYCAVGDTVYAIGNPLNLSLRGTFTEGMISGIQRQMTVDDKTYTMLQTSAALNNGNSGGPLINDRGQVIGINTMKLSNTDAVASATIEGMGFALPSAYVTFVANDILTFGEFRGVPTFGFVIGPGDVDGQTRVAVLSVEADSPAEKAGIRANDVIVAVDDVEVKENWDILDYRYRVHAGDEVVVTVLRSGTEMQFTVTLSGTKQ